MDSLREPSSLETYPLAPMQGGMLVEARLSRGRVIDIEQVVVRAPALDGALLRRAWQTVADRHPALRTSFVLEDGRPMQAVRPQLRVDLGEHVLEGGDEEALSELLERDRRAGLDVSKPPWRVALARLSSGADAFVWTFHHLILDGRSIQIVVEEAFAVYDALARGDTPDLPPPPVSFRSHVEALAQLDTPAAESFFRDLLAGADRTHQLPWLGPPREEGGLPRHVEEEDRLPASVVARLTSLASEHGLSLNAIVQGALAIVIGRVSRTDDVILGATRACRHLVPGGEGIVGCLINTVPVRAQPAPDRSAREYFAGIRKQHLDVRPFEHTPLARVQTLAPGPRTRPLCDVLVVFENRMLGTTLRELGGAWANRDCKLVEQGSSPLTLACYLDGDLVLRLEHDPGRVRREHAAAMLRYLVTLLRSFADAPDARVGELSMIPPDEARSLASRGVPARPVETGPEGYATMFRRVAAARGEHVALEGPERALTYAALDARSDRAAAGLVASGVVPGQKIALALPRSVDLFVAQLAALKAGVVFVPLDLRRPAASLAEVAEDAEVRLVVGTESLGGAPTATVDELVARGTAAPIPDAPDGEAVAYSLYTSGSTGKPKGVLVPNRALLAHNRAIVREYGLGGGDRALQFASPAFDVALEEVYPTWLAGGTVVLRSEAASESLEAFLDEVGSRRISVLNLPTAFFHELVHRMAEDGVRLPRHVRLVVIGGEKVSARAFDTFLALPGAPRLLNAYGPTEATITCTIYDPDRDPREPGSDVPVGHSLASARAYVLDARRDVVPDGAIGELYVGGPTVALGYHARPELTAERFVPDPFAPGGVMYATGDLAKIDAQGRIEFHGRVDHQVKIRGYRIELGEVESALRALPEVRDALVRARKIGQGDRIVAWVVPHGRRGTSVEPLAAALAQRLPEYMLPRHYVFVNALPVAPGGKVDERALPDPDLVTTGEHESGTPRHDLDRKLLALFEEALGLRSIGIHDGFYDLGGHSLLALRLSHVISRATGHEIDLATLLRAQTVAALADAIERGELKSDTPSIVPIQPTGSRPAIFGVHVLGMGGIYYRPLARRLGPDQPIYGLTMPLNLEGGRKPTVEEVARAYVADLRRFQPHGPYFLLAVSLGGLTALEVARLLTESGEEVALLGMCDAIGPMPIEWVSRRERARRHLEQLLRGGADYVRGKISGRVQRIGEELDTRMLRLRRAMGLEMGEREVQAQAVEENVQLAMQFKPRPYAGRITVFRATEDVYYTDAFLHEAKLGWAHVAQGGVEMIDVPGDHLTLLQEPHVEALAREVQRIVDDWMAAHGGQRSSMLGLRSADDRSGPRLVRPGSVAPAPSDHAVAAGGERLSAALRSGPPQ